MSKISQDKHSEKSFWDKVAYERIYAAFDESEYLEVFDKSLGQDLTGKTIVDVGCASGVSAALLASRGAKVLGVDISPELISQATKLWPEYSNRLEFTVGDAECLNIDNETADACFFGGVLHHFPEKENVYKELLRVLKHGGIFVALEPNQLDFIERLEWAVADLRGKLSPNEYPIDPNEMRRELKDSGFLEVEFWTTRHDIPVLAQIPILRNFFNRQKGFHIKEPILRFFNLFRSHDHRGTFFVIRAVKP